MVYIVEFLSFFRSNCILYMDFWLICLLGVSVTTHGCMLGNGCSPDSNWGTCKWIKAREESLRGHRLMVIIPICPQPTNNLFGVYFSFKHSRSSLHRLTSPALEVWSGRSPVVNIQGWLVQYIFAFPSLFSPPFSWPSCTLLTPL